MKSFCASVVTYGAKPLFYMKGITPASETVQAPKETITIEESDLKNAYDNINDQVSDIDFVCVGCPHCSIKEIAEIARPTERQKSRREHGALGCNITHSKATSRQTRLHPSHRGSRRKIRLRHLHGSCPAQGQIQSVGNNFGERLFLLKAEPHENQDGQHGRMRKRSGDWKMEQLKGRIIYKGKAEGEALTTTQPISFYGGVDPNTGVVIEKGHELQGQSVKGKILVFPQGKGSTVGSYTLYRLKKNGAAPAGMVNRECETISSSWRHNQRNPVHRQSRHHQNQDRRTKFD